MNKDQQAAHDQAGSSHVLIARENPDVADLIVTKPMDKYRMSLLSMIPR
jgi:hypothetical protein